MEIQVGKKYWTMVGKKPHLLKVYDRYVLEPLGGSPYYKYWLVNECSRTVFERLDYELFETYEALRDFVFPPINQESITLPSSSQ